MKRSTGCDTGLGRQISIELKRKGFLVISTCLSLIDNEDLQDQVDLLIQCDVTKEDDIVNLQSKCEQFLQQTGRRLWAIINNAGIAPLGCFDWMHVENFIKVMDVNYFGLVRVTKALLPSLKKTKNSRIINMSSVAGLLGCPYMSGYCAAKHAVEGMTKALRTELTPWNIHVANINPSFTRCNTHD